MPNEDSKTTSVFLPRTGWLMSGLALLLGICIGAGAATGWRFNVRLDAEKVHWQLENVYFISGVALAVLAAFGLRQLRLTREGINLTREQAYRGQQREAMKLALQQCTRYAERIAPEHSALHARYGQHPEQYTHAVLDKNLLQPSFTVANDQIQIPNFDLQAVQQEMDKLHPILFLNLLEGFAIPFSQGMANDDVGYYEVGIPFIELVQTFMPCFHALRIRGRGRFLSVIALYERWQNRYRKEQLLMIRENLDRQINEHSNAVRTGG